MNKFSLGHAHLLFIKAFDKLSCLVCKPFPCVFVCLVMRERFGCAHPPLLFITAFELLCLVYKPYPCVFMCLVTRERSGCAHAPLLFIKVTRMVHQ